MDLKIQEALETILAQESRGYLMQYAQAYATAALQNKMEGEELRVQLLYVLNNLTGWRGETARETKKTLKTLKKPLPNSN